MSGYIDYLNESLSDVENSKALEDFKRKISTKMNKRAAEFASVGITDDKIISEMIIKEFPDLKAQYWQEVATAHNAAPKAKKNTVKSVKIGFLGVAGYVLLLVFAFLSISFLTSAWGKTWLILVGGLLAPAGALMISSAFKSKKGGIIQRASIFFGTMLIVTVLFLFMLIGLGITKSWILFLLGILSALIIDAAYATVCKEKVTYGTYIMYLPVVATLFYVVGGLAKFIPWHPGWLIIIASVVVDIFLLLYKVVTDKK